MFARLLLFAALLASSVVAGASPRRVYAVRWNAPSESSAEQRALIDEVDSQLRAELRKRGASIVDGASVASAIVLRPSIEILPSALRLNVIGVRGADQKLLGTISAKAAGSSRSAQLKALVTRACAEAEQLEP